MSTDRFHKAAKDGLIEVLREATRKECNHKDESGMTPTLWAAFEGHMEALRMLCGRGGEPDKADIYGNTALHLAAARGHKNCVTFLFKFGANVYSTTCEGHTAQELAAINGRDDILRYLDNATAKLENYDRKKAKLMKEKAKKEHEKSQQQYMKLQNKAEILAEKEMQKLAKEWGNGNSEENTSASHRFTSNHLTAEVSRPTTYRALISSVSSGSRGLGAVYKKALASKLRQNQNGSNVAYNDFKVGELEETGRRSVTSLSGLRRDSEVLFVGTFSAGPQPRAPLADVFDSPDSLSGSVSQPDYGASTVDPGGISQEVQLQDSCSMFIRPGFGRIVFRQSLLATISGAMPIEGGTGGDAEGEELPNKSASSLAHRAYKPADWNTPESENEISDEEPVEESEYASLERFLSAWEIAQYLPKFKDEQIDLDALMLLTEDELKTLGLPLGPYKKLVTAVKERRGAVKARQKQNGKLGSVKI